MKQIKSTFLLIILILASSISAKRSQQPKTPITPIAKQTSIQKQVISAQKQNVVSPTTTKDEIKIKYGMATAQNKRDYQEDRFAHALIQNMKNENIGEFFGVYDGHLGDKASSHLQANLHIYFTECLTNTTMSETFQCAFLKAENYALQNFDDGSTAIVAYIDKNELLHLAWVGDSRAVLEKNGTVDFATQDHKPNRKKELNRIVLAGGKEEVWRRLEVSRSIGNRRLKNALKGQSIALPEYTEIKLHSDNHFLIMASDGLWDVIKNQEAIDFVKKQLENFTDINVITLNLQNEAINRGSKDNITVCIVIFNELEKVNKSSFFTRFWKWIQGN